MPEAVKLMRYVGSLALAAASACMALAAGEAARADADHRHPNIVMIISDDQS